MKTIIRISLIAFVLGLFATAEFSQTRITFKPGAKSAIVAGTLSGLRDHRSYVIHVRRGQIMSTINAGGNHITVEIKPPPGATYESDLAADCHDHQEVDPTAAGDYKIIVTECAKADRWRGKFRLRITVR